MSQRLTFIIQEILQELKPYLTLEDAKKFTHAFYTVSPGLL